MSFIPTVTISTYALCCSLLVLNQLCPIVISLMFMRISMCVRSEVNLERIYILPSFNRVEGRFTECRDKKIPLKNKQRKYKISNRSLVMKVKLIAWMISIMLHTVKEMRR